MPAGAGHDAQVVGRVAPAGMIFIPCREGRSHSPLEHAEDRDCENGANVLLHTALRLANA
jgi:N-carbamoyl-L-amino-acid hydrolase